MDSKVKVFFWCSSESHDKKLLEGLLRLLSVYKWQAFVDIECSDNIEAGAETAQIFRDNFSAAHILLPLVSQYFPWDQEAEEKLLSRWKAGEIKAFIIFLSPISLRDTKFAGLTVLPTDNRPVDSWEDTTRALFSIAEYLDKEIKQTIIENLIQEALYYRNEHQYKEAQRNYQQILTFDDRSYLARRGIEDVDRILKENAEQKTHYIQRIEKCMAEQQYSLALSVCQEMEENLPEEVFLIYKFRGDALRGNANYEEALACYKKALALDAQSPQVLVGMGEAYLKLGKYKTTVSCFLQAKTISPKSSTILRRLGEIFMSLKRFEEALSTMNEVVSIGTYDGQVYADIGVAYLECKKYREAVQAFDQAISLSCKNVSVYMRKGQALSALKIWPQARIAYEEAMEHNHDHAQLYKELADVLYEMRLYQPAENYYTRAIDLSPNLVSAFDGRARARENLAEEDRRTAKHLRESQGRPSSK